MAHELTIPGVLESAADRFGDAEALVGDDVRITFRELAAEVDRAARAYVASGLQPGERIAIWAPNIWEWPIAALGAYRAGLTVIPVNTRFKGPEARYILEKSAARVLFSVTDFLDTDYVAMLPAAERPATLEEVFVLRGPASHASQPFDEFLARADAVDPSESAKRANALNPDDISDILFTSGTTGAPKGAMLRHGASVRAYTDWAGVVGLREGDRYLIVNPYFHAFGLKAGILACLITGATNIPHPVFDVPSVMRRVDEEKVTMLPGPPAVYQTMLDHPDLGSFDLSTLRLAVTGSAPVPVEMIERMRNELTFQTIVTGYGLTESTGIAAMNRHDDPPEIISGTDGRAIPDVEIVIVGEDGAEVPRGEPGELLVRGYNVMAGYLDAAEATAEAIDADGWLHTGDVATMDDGGNIRITDRTKDMFIVGGFNAYPAEIENMMLHNQAISQVAVVGIPDHRMGEVGAAFVVPRPGETIDPDELIAWCREQMANYKVPRKVFVVDALPMNASNKVLKFELRDRAMNSDRGAAGSQ